MCIFCLLDLRLICPVSFLNCKGSKPLVLRWSVLSKSWFSSRTDWVLRPCFVPPAAPYSRGSQFSGAHQNQVARDNGNIFGNKFSVGPQIALAL